MTPDEMTVDELTLVLDAAGWKLEISDPVPVPIGHGWAVEGIARGPEGREERLTASDHETAVRGLYKVIFP